MASPFTRLPARLGAAVSVVALGAALGCSRGSGEAAVAPEGPAGLPGRRPLVSVADSLCRAAAEATTDTQTARVTFFAEAHGGLHTIAGELTDIDRKAAGELLRAKQAVEETLATSLEPAAELNDALARLHAATLAGLARLDVTAEPCPSPPTAP